mgnify:CR=1 FL=1
MPRPTEFADTDDGMRVTGIYMGGGTSLGVAAAIALFLYAELLLQD